MALDNNDNDLAENINMKEFFAQGNNNIDEDFLIEKKPKGRKVFFILLILTEFILLLGITWYGSAIFLSDMAKNAVENNNIELAERYLSYYCPFGYEAERVVKVKENISNTKNTISDVNKQLKVNDFIPAINNSKMIVDMWNGKYNKANELYNEASDKAVDWLEKLYKENKFDDMVKAVENLSFEVWNDLENDRLNKFKLLYSEKADKLLSSAIKYYNNHEPEKAEKNLMAVKSILAENENADKLQEKIDIYNKNKKYITEAQKYFDNKEYYLALESYKKADNYTKTVYSDLRAKIVEEKKAYDIDERFGEYVGTYTGIADEGYNDELVISKISKGQIWLEGSFGNESLSYTYSAAGISIQGNSVKITGVSSTGNETINSIETFIFGDGFMAHKHTSSKGEKTYLMYRN